LVVLKSELVGVVSMWFHANDRMVVLKSELVGVVSMWAWF
jgi:hypothetical protein